MVFRFFPPHFRLGLLDFSNDFHPRHSTFLDLPLAAAGSAGARKSPLQFSRKWQNKRNGIILGNCSRFLSSERKMDNLFLNLCLKNKLILKVKTTRNQEQNYFRVKNNTKSGTTCICNLFVSVAQQLFSFDYPKFNFQIQSEANQCINLFQIQNNKKSLHSFILTFCTCRPKVIFIWLPQIQIPNSKWSKANKFTSISFVTYKCQI